MRTRCMSCWNPRAQTFDSSRPCRGRRGRNRNGRSSSTVRQLSQCSSGIAVHIPRDVLQIVVVSVMALHLRGREALKRRVWNAGQEQTDEGIESGVKGLVRSVQPPDVLGEPVEGSGNALLGCRDY